MLKAVLRGLPFRAGGGGGGGAFAGGGKEYATRSKAAANRRQQATTAKGVAATLLWMAFSSLLIIYNKRLYQAGFGFPMFVTGMGQVFSALGGWVLVTAGFLPLRPPPSPRFFLTALLPIVASTAATMFFGNYAYLYLSVAFIQILKAFTPAITLLLCVLFRIERFSKALFASVMLIALGTAGAVLIESGTPAFHLIGFLSFLASALTEASRVVGVAMVLQGEQRYNSAESLIYISAPSAVALLLGSAIWEGQGIATKGPQVFATNRDDFLAAFCMSALVNLTCFFAVELTSPVTFKVAGCVKNLIVVWYGAAVHGDHVTVTQIGGYFVSVLGFAMYVKLKNATTGSGGGGSKAAAASAAAGGAKKYR